MRRAVLLGPVLAVAVLLAGCGGGANRRDYISRNESILASLPVLPGAVKAHETSTPAYADGELSSPSGYITSVDYRVPRGTRGASVVRFYDSRLERRGWRVSLRRAAALHFTREASLVALNTVFLSPARGKPLDWIYELSVDYRGAAR